MCTSSAKIRCAAEDCRFKERLCSHIKRTVANDGIVQAGCRLLQQLLDEPNGEITELIFKEARPHLCELMTDAFGNYLFQKLLETADEEQRTNIIETVSTQMQNGKAS